MKEPYIEGVATHDDPESYAAVGNGVGEALTGARAGWVLSREISQSRTPRRLTFAEGHMRRSDSASTDAALRGRRPHARTESSCTGTGRSPRRPERMARRAASERPTAVRR
jgi:RNA-directed DNA polymerase